MPAWAKGRKLQNRSEDGAKWKGNPANFRLLELFSGSDRLNFPGGIVSVGVEDSDTLL